MEGLVGLKHQFRVILFIASYLVISGFVIINAYVISLANYDEIATDITNYLLCLAATFSTEACEDVHNDDHPNYPSVLVQVWLQSIRAGVYLLIFGVQSRYVSGVIDLVLTYCPQLQSVFLWWAHFFRCICTFSLFLLIVKDLLTSNDILSYLQVATHS